MPIDLSAISRLREKTGAGLGDCKKALEEAGGDEEKAVEVLRKKGEIKAAKKVDRQTSEGVIAFARSADRLAVVGVSCETDFAAKNPDFVAAVDELAKKLLVDGDAAAFRTWAEEYIKQELVIKIGENIQLKDAEIFALTADQVAGTYLHFHKKSAAAVILAGGSEQLANDLAMQVVAMTPGYLDQSAVPTEVLEKEKEIYRAQLAGEGKPAEMIEKILVGKLNKFFEDNCLVNQTFIKDETQKISALLAASGAKIAAFKRFQI